MKKLKLVFKLTMQVSKIYPLIYLGISLLNTLLLLFNVFIPKFLLDALTKYSLTKTILLSLMLLVSYRTISLIMTYLIKQKDIIQSKLYYRIVDNVHIKMSQLSYEYLEDPKFLNLKESAVFPLYNQGAIINVLNVSLEILKHAINIITMLGILMTLGYQIILILFLGIVINICISLLSRKYLVRFYQSLIPINREFNFYFNDEMDVKTQKEYRLYQAEDMIMEKMCKVIDNIGDFLVVCYNRIGFYNTMLQIVSSLQSVLVYGFITVKTLTYHYSIAEFTLFTGCALSFSTSINAIIDNVAKFIQVLSFLEPLKEFDEIEVTQTKGDKKVSNTINKIKFEHVSFKYPRSDNYILKDVSFTIYKNQKIGIVGLNGAGKTTLIKLLCRLYTPTSGTIYINDNDIQDYDINEYYKLLSCVFQDFSTFAYSIKENISPDFKGDIDNLLKQVGLSHLNPDVVLNRQFSDKAIELSGGQSQKLAIARAIYKDSPIMILDEPTSALDPLFESEIYQLYNSMIKDKIGIYITHRMSSSQFCDKIVVIDQGQVVDFDTHEKLMEKHDSLYYQLYTTQANNYIN